MSLELEREQAVQELCAHYAQDHLTTGELEQRFDGVYKASSRDQLRTVLVGLPALSRTSVAPAPIYQLAHPPTPTNSWPAVEERRYVAIFSEVKKEGHWMPAARIRARIVFGAMVLDLREAELPLEGITVDVDVFAGECRILLPPGVGADVDASAFMGSVEDKAQRGLPSAPMIHVRGSAFMGSIIVKTQLPKPARMESWRKQLKAFFGTDGESE